jgi:hypothetical protein
MCFLHMFSISLSTNSPSITLSFRLYLRCYPLDTPSICTPLIAYSSSVYFHLFHLHSLPHHQPPDTIYKLYYTALCSCIHTLHVPILYTFCTTVSIYKVHKPVPFFTIKLQYLYMVLTYSSSVCSEKYIQHM